MQLHTETSGNGQAHLVFVHGLGGDGRVWTDLARCALTTGRYTVTTVDLRGHGRSARSTVYTVQAFADDLLDTLPVGVDALGSHSLGGAVTARAVPELLPRRAAYLDPGFSIALPTTGVGGQLVRRAR